MTNPARTYADWKIDAILTEYAAAYLAQTQGDDTAVARMIELRDELVWREADRLSLIGFARNVSESLNSGDGVYRP